VPDSRCIEKVADVYTPPLALLLVLGEGAANLELDIDIGTDPNIGNDPPDRDRVCVCMFV